MKNKLAKIAGAILFSLLLPFGLFSQVADVGIVRNGQPVVTNLKNATTVLKGGLSDAASISNVYIEHEPQSGKYYLVGYVQNDRITGKAIELQPGTGGTLRAAAGPGLEITCTGFKCGRCVPKITKWSVHCVCEDANPPADMECNMTSKVVITAW